MKPTAWLALFYLLASGPAALAQTAAAPAPLNTQQLLADVQVLASDSLAGRLTGDAGGLKAKNYLLRRFAALGLQKFGGSYEQPFRFKNRRGDTIQATNLIGYIKGTQNPDRYLVLCAHYDHLGTRNGQVFAGADDNASGVATILALAAYFKQHPPQHSLIIFSPDAEEQGLQGAKHFVAHPPVPLEAIALNINIDMLSRNDSNEFYACGPHHFPGLKPLIEAQVVASSPAKLRFGHDQPGLPPGQDWSSASDHGPFFRAGIPFIYFGVEDHADYHRPTDTFARIQPAFFAAAAEQVRQIVAQGLDPALGRIQAMKKAGR
ncbi:MAG: M28 family peptidase [Bernardetiaceae bacterium]|jgi:Zn-dependent M28 family amino/carboxypeptidase|nr:M28 family peptidase [Bernardetiaceae bacterium]